jgi:iron complex outermembrane receptor protein
MNISAPTRRDFATFRFLGLVRITPSDTSDRRRARKKKGRSFMTEMRRMSLFISAAATHFLLLVCVTAHAQSPQAYLFDVPGEPLGDALRVFGQVSRQQIIFSEEAVRGKRSSALVGTFTVDEGLQRLLTGSGLKIRRTSAGVIDVESAEANGPLAPAQSAEELSEVVVTGSRIGQAANTIQAAPTTVIEGAELDMRGFNQAGQMLNLVTSNAPEVPVSQAEGYPAGSGQTYPDLFGLGDSRTLTLIDGRRMVTSASGLGPRTIDVNVIPTGLIDRIEIDQAGGAAVYGSDAIAGVVNYVLKKNFQGLEVDATDGISSRGDYHTPGFKAMLGQNFADGRGNIAVDFEWSKTPPLLETERPPFKYGDEAIANPSGSVPPEIYAPNVRSWNFNSNGIIFTNANSYYFGLPFLPNPSGLLQVKGSPVQFSSNGTSVIPYNTGAIQFPTGQAIGGQGYPETELSTLLAGVERYTGAVIGHFDLTDHLTISNQFLWAREVGSDPLGTEVFLNFVGGSGPYGPIPFYKNNAYLTPSEVATLSAANPAFAAGQPLYLSKFSNWLPTGRNDANYTDTWREMLTVSGDFRIFARDFTWSASDAYAETDSKMESGDEYVSHFNNAVDGVTNAAGQIVCAVNAVKVVDPGCQPINIFGVTPGTLQAAARNYISIPAGQWIHNSMNDFLATMGGDLVSLPAGKAKFSLAYEHRNEASRLLPFESDLLGLGSQGTSFANSGSYYTNEGSVELLVPLIGNDFKIPLVEKVDLHGSFREVDNTLSGHDRVWGSDLRWDVGYGVTLRATKSSNFSQPTLGELIQPPTVGYLPAQDPCSYTNINGGPNPSARRANCQSLFDAHPGYGPLASFYDPSETAGTVAVTSQGNPNLVSETSSTVTYGIVFKPAYIPGLSLTADRIEINLHEALQQFSIQNFVDTCFDSSVQPASICNTFTRTAQGALNTGLAEYFNAGFLNYRGETYKADYLLPLNRLFTGREWGVLKFSVDATHNALLNESVTGFDSTAYRGTISEPAWVGRFDLRYAIGHLRVLYSIYHLPTSLIGPGANVTNSPEPYNVASNSLQSLSMEYDYHQVTFRGGIQNLTDELPSFPTRSYGDIIGRQFFVGIHAKIF